jgi:hypothetical protein
VELTAHRAGVAERAANGVACSSMAGTASGVAGAAGMTLGVANKIFDKMTVGTRNGFYSSTKHRMK